MEKNIQSRNLTQGFHWHHIKPRYQGGQDTLDNLVLLHPIDHAIWHLVRYRMNKNPADLHAAKILMGSLGEDGTPINTMGVARPQFRDKNNPACQPGVGAKISAAKKGITTRIGYNLSTDHRQKIGLANKGKCHPKYTCPHCGTQAAGGNYAKYHGDRCQALARTAK